MLRSNPAALGTAACPRACWALSLAASAGSLPTPPRPPPSLLPKPDLFAPSGARGPYSHPAPQLSDSKRSCHYPDLRPARHDLAFGDSLWLLTHLDVQCTTILRPAQGTEFHPAPQHQPTMVWAEPVNLAGRPVPCLAMRPVAIPLAPPPRPHRVAHQPEPWTAGGETSPQKSGRFGAMQSSLLAGSLLAGR